MKKKTQKTNQSVELIIKKKGDNCIFKWKV